MFFNPSIFSMRKVNKKRMYSAYLLWVLFVIKYEKNYLCKVHVAKTLVSIENNMEKKAVCNRIDILRELMRRENLGAFIFPSTDPHNGEYVPEHWKGREWISGFNGSAGVVVITMNSAALWTDSRYFIAVKEQLEGTGIQLMKLKIAGTPSIPEWIGKMLSEENGSTEVGIDGKVVSCAEAESLISELRRNGGLTLRTNLDPLAVIWKDRPVIPENVIEIHPIELAGEMAPSKISRIRKALREMHCDGMLVSALDDIAWTLNLRGTDVHCNPVFVSYLLISSTSVILYVNAVKVSPEVKNYLEKQGVDIAPYEDVETGLRKYGDYNILLDANETNYTLAKAMCCPEIVRGPSPVPLLKVVKNQVEIDGFHRAMLRDGVALVKFLMWLKPAVKKGGVTEVSVDKKLTALRAEQPLFRDISFDTIAGYETHGAIVHYEATPETDILIEPHGLLLLDSGAQYLDGTTDITRTIALGPITEEQKHIYTLVLKGHIALELCKFPANASGSQIDALAREAMWREGLNFLHGTGHGVGSYLNVHEGLHQIRMEWKPAPLQEGMTVTDEPGLYLEGKFGVRIENILIIVPYKSTVFGEFLGFEPLTLCPIDTAPIDFSMMTTEEIEWLNGYHDMVYKKLAPHLDEDERQWLCKVCTAV